MTKDERNEFEQEVARLVDNFYMMMNRGKSDSQLQSSFSELYRTASSFKGEYSFSIEIPLPTHTGAKKMAHLRLVQGIFPEFKSAKTPTTDQIWRSGWMSVVLDEVSREVYEGGIDEIVRIISKQFEANPVKLIRVAEGKVYIVYSWHSLRFRLLPTQAIANLDEKLPKVPLTMNQLIEVPDSSTLQVICMNSEFSTPNEFIKLIKWMSLDVPKECRPSSQKIENRFRKYTRRQNSLDILFQAGYLKEKTILEFVPPHMGTFGNSFDNELAMTCSVTSQNGKPHVVWNSELFSITGLTRTIFEVLQIKADLEHLNGNLYWKKCGDDKTLFQRANELVRVNLDRDRTYLTDKTTR